MYCHIISCDTEACTLSVPKSPNTAEEDESHVSAKLRYSEMYSSELMDVCLMLPHMRRRVTGLRAVAAWLTLKKVR
jgi:hypothetical protein